MAFKRDKTLAAAQKAVRKGNLERAIKEYKLLIDDDPSDKRTRLKLADILVKSSKLDEALQEYRHVGKQYASEDFHEKAAAIYKQALRIAPNDATLHQNLGFAYFQYGRAKDAIRAYSKAERIYNENGETAAHLSILEKMLDVDQENVGIQIQLAERCEKNGFRERAIQFFENAAAQLQNEGRTDEYIQVCERLIFLAPDQTPIRKALIRIYHGRSDNRRALRHLQICFKSTPDDIETLELLGSTFHRLDENKKALLVYKQLATNLQSNPARSREVYQTILRIDPSDQDAIKVLGIAQTRVAAFPTPILPETSLETDSLAGVTFLDDDDDDDDFHVPPTTVPPRSAVAQNIAPTIGFSGDVSSGVETSFGDDFLDFAEDAMREFDDFNLDDLDEIPTFRSVATKPADEIPFLDIDEEPLDTPEITSEKLRPILASYDVERITEILAEAEVFIKYNLLDQAKEVLLNAVSIAPDELESREQLAIVLERNGERDAAARQWVEVARIYVQANDPTKANSFIRRALSTNNNSTQVRADIQACGITGDVFLAGPSPQIPTSDFNESISRLDEISTSFLDIEQDPALTGASEIIADEPEEELTALDIDMDVDFDFDEALTIDSDVLLDDEDEDVFDMLFQNSEATALVPPIPKIAPVPEPSSNGNGFGSISLTNAFKSINGANEPSSAAFLNTHLELGTTYLQMELYEDAIVEFRLAMEDPTAIEAATMQIALCQIELGDAGAAKANFRRLLNNPNISAELRQSATEHLSKI